MGDFKKGIFIGPDLLPIVRAMPAELLKETLMWMINDAEDTPQDDLSVMGRVMVMVFLPSVHAAQKVAERRHNAAVKNGRKKGKGGDKAKSQSLVASKKNAVATEVESALVTSSVPDSSSTLEEQAEETKSTPKKPTSREKKKTKVQQAQQQTLAVEDESQSENEKVVEEEQKVEDFKSDNRLFEIFWHTYPNKENKRKAFEEWTSLVSSSEWPGLPVILEALRREIFARGWDGPDAPEDCPEPAAWLHFMSWK